MKSNDNITVPDPEEEKNHTRNLSSIIHRLINEKRYINKNLYDITRYKVITVIKVHRLCIIEKKNHILRYLSGLSEELRFKKIQAPTLNQALELR